MYWSIRICAWCFTSDSEVQWRGHRHSKWYRLVMLTNSPPASFIAGMNRRFLARVFLFSLWRYFFITILNTHNLTSLAETFPVKTNTIQWCFQNQLYWCSLYFHRCMPPRRGVRTLVPWAARYKGKKMQRTSKERERIAHVHTWVQTIAKHDLIAWFHCQNANNRSINLKPTGGSRVYCYRRSRWLQCF